MHQRIMLVWPCSPAVRMPPAKELADNAAIRSLLKFRRCLEGLALRSGVAALALLLLAIAPGPAKAVISVETADHAAVAPTVLSALKSDAERQAEAIARALGVDPDGTVWIVIAREFSGHEIEVSRSYPEASLIIIPPHVLARQIVPLAHELTHIIAGRGADDVLSEGLAVYSQDRFGSDPAFPNFGRPIDIALRDTIIRRYGANTWPDALRSFELELGPTPDRTAVLSRWINDTHDSDTRRLAYLTSASYVGYLVDSIFKGDMKTFYPFYRSGSYAQGELSPETAWSGWLRALRDS